MLDTLHFDNRFVRLLPGDPASDNRRRQVHGACYSRVLPTPVAAPRLMAWSAEVAELVGLPAEACAGEALVEVFAGNRVLPAMDPWAACYGGHQFGTWAGQLGDGRAINLGEVVNGHGRWILQLKGAGPTPYSRTADGLAVLRSSVREFLCSEAMHHLGVPTTRALCLVTTGEQVVRDMFYDGHPKAEPGAVLCRVSRSFTRYGSFEILAARGETDLLRRLVDYTIETDFPELGAASPEARIAWFHEVCGRTAELMVQWMRVGFVHGVMNTDNMSILGETIDYGPYGWLEGFDPDWTPNTTDAGGRRYRFGQQPRIAAWNLVQLANALHPVIAEVAPLEEGLALYTDTYERRWREMMAAKLGLDAFDPKTDEDLVHELLMVLQLVETDMTIFHRNLARVGATAGANSTGNGAGDGGPSDDRLLAPLTEAYYDREALTGDARARTVRWLRRYIERVRRDGTADVERRRRMDRVNPKYVLRNFLAQLAIDRAEQGDGSMIDELHDLLRRPYDEQPAREAYAARRPEWARHRPGCSMLSCSS